MLAPTFSLAAMLALTDISDAAISPNGSEIVFVARRADPQRNRYSGTLWIYDVGEHRLRRLDSSAQSYASPAWSPNGTQIAVVARDAATRTQQLFLVDPKTGRTTRLTSGKSSVDDFAWRPDGRAIAFVRKDVAPVRHGAAAFDDAFEVGDNAYLATAAAQPRHLWLAALRGARAVRLTSGVWSVADSTISWSPHGRRLLYLRVPNGIAGVQDRAAAYVLDVAAHRSVPASPHRSYEDQASWSPDGRRLLYLYLHGGDSAGEADAVTIRTDGTHERDRTAALDRNVDAAVWMPAGSALLFKVYDATSGPLYEMALHAKARRLPMGRVVDAQLGAQPVAKDGTVAFVGTQAHRPNELYLLRPGAAAPMRLTHFNDAIAGERLGRVTTVRWTYEGFHEQGVLTYPPSYVAGRTYPLVLRIHGGPNETSEAAFSRFYQLAAAHGYLVFSPNYRGSTNDGNAFERAIFDDASAGPGRDVMAGIEAVERMGIVDRTRIAVSGWSYGGQLTSWMIGHYQIWKCAVTGAAVNDLVVDYTIADDIDADRAGFSGSPFAGDDLKGWESQSPITSFKDIHTPLLMLGNVYDVRVPIVEQYEMFHALRDNGIPVRFFAYPSGGHLPNGPDRLADAYRRWLSWFDRYLHP